MAYCSACGYGDNTVTTVPAWQTSLATLVGAGAAIYAAATTIPAATDVVSPIVPATPGLFEPGGFVSRNQGALLVGAAALALFLLTRKRKGRR